MMSERDAILDMNLLPNEHRPPQVSGWALAFAGILAVCLLITVPLAFRAEAAGDQAAAANDLAEQAQIELEGVEAELAQARALRTETDVATFRTAALQSEREALQGGTRPLSEDLFWLYGFGFLPEGARITAVDAAEVGFAVTATGVGPLDGVSYAAKLVETGGFPAARMTSFTPGSQDRGTFVVEVTR